MRLWENWNSHTQLAGMENSAATLENDQAVPQKITHVSATLPSNSAPSDTHKRNENVRPHQERPCVNGQSSISHKSHKVETTQMSMK